MKVKLVIDPERMAGTCDGCIYYQGVCCRPSSQASCIIKSNYGYHFGHYIGEGATLKCTTLGDIQ